MLLKYMYFSGVRSAKTVSSTKLSTMTASYTCTAPRVINFKPVAGTDDEEYEFSMTISDVKIQAFSVNGTKYSPGMDCQNNMLLLVFTFSQIIDHFQEMPFTRNVCRSFVTSFTR